MDPNTNKEQFLKKNKKKKKKTSRYEGVRGGEKLIKSICELAFPESPDILTPEEMAKFEFVSPSERSKTQKGPATLQLKPSNVYSYAFPPISQPLTPTNATTVRQKTARRKNQTRRSKANKRNVKRSRKRKKASRKSKMTSRKRLTKRKLTIER